MCHTKHLLSLIAICGVLFVATETEAQTVAYTNANIVSLGKAGNIEDGTLVVQGDKISDIGADVQIPADARVVSLQGKTVIPGIIDPYYVYRQSSSTATRTVTFRGRTITIRGSGRFTPGSFIKVGEYFYPYKTNFKPALRSGITVANLVSDGRGLSALANMTDEPSPEMLFQPEGFLFAKVTNQTSALDVVRKPLAPSKPSSRSSSTTATDKTKELWQKVKEGEAPLFINMNNAASVAYTLKFLSEKANEKVDVVIVATGPNIYPVLDQISKRKKTRVILQPGIDVVPFKSNLMNVSKMLADRNIPFAISPSLIKSQLQTMQDDPMFPIAMLVKTGLKKETALQAITSEPAKLLGLDKTHGTLEKDKHANFLVFDGDPLETGSRLEQVFLNGNKIHEN